MPTSARPPEDVSCRAIGNAIDLLQRRGRPLAPFLRGLNRTPEQLLDPAGWIGWDEYVTFVRNCDALLTRDEFVELSTGLRRSRLLAPLFLAAGVWLDPARYFVWAADPIDGGLSHLFPCLETGLARRPGGELTVVVRLRPGLAPPPDSFWEAVELALAALPTHFGLPAAAVRREPLPGGMGYAVRPPRPRRLRFALSWLGSWFRRSRAAEARAALAIGYERNRRAEAELAEHRAEAALRESERRFRQVADAVPGVVYRYSRGPGGDERFEYVSAGVERLTGVTAAEAEADARALWATAQPDDVSGLLQSVLVSQRDRTPWEAEFRVTARDGTCRWLRGRATPEPDDGSGRVVWNGLFLDVTAEKRAEGQARVQAARIAALAANSNVIIEELDRDGVIRYANRGSAGRTPDELIGRTIFDLLEPADRDAGRRVVSDVFETGRTFAGTFAARDGTGDLRHYSVSVSPVRTGGAIERLALTAFDVTDRVRAEAALRESEGRFRTLVDDLDVGVVLQDAGDRILLSNPAAARVLGLTEDQLRGVTSRDPRWKLVRADGSDLPPDEVPSVVAARTGRPVRGAVVGATNLATGGRVWIEVSAAPRPIPGGPAQVLVTLIDVTDRVHAEEGLRQREELFRLAADASQGMIYDLDLASRRVFRSPALARLLGYGPDDLRGTAEGWAELIHPDDRPRVMAMVDAARAAGDRFEAEYRVRHKGGHYIDGWDRALIVRDPGGRPVRLVGSLLDVSGRKRAEEGLRARDALLRKLSELVPGAFYQFQQRPDGTAFLPFASEGFRRTHEVDPAVLGASAAPAFDRIHPDDLGRVAESVRRSAEALEPWSCEFRVVLPRAGLRWQEGHSTPERLPDGGTLWHGYVHDVTDRKRAEEALRESEEHLRLALAAAELGVLRVDNRADRIRLSDRAARLFDLPAEEPLPRAAVHARTHPDDRAEVDRRIARALDPSGDGLFACEYRVVRADGSIGWVNVRKRRLDAAGKCESLGVVADVTARRQAEEGLREQAAFVQGVLDAMSAHVAVLDRAGRITAVNAAWTGFADRNAAPFDPPPPHTGVGVNYLDVCVAAPGDCTDGRAAAAAIRRVIDGTSARESFDYACHSPTERRWFLMNVTPLRRGRGEVVVAHTEVTQQRLAEERVRESEGRFRAMADAAPVLIWLADTSKACVWFNRQWLEFTGRPMEAEVGYGWAEAVHPDDYARCLSVYTEAFDRREPFQMEYRLRRHDGAFRWLLDTGVPRLDPGGGFAGYIGSCVDITDRRLAEEAVAARERELQALADNTPAVLTRFDRDLRHLFVNAAVERFAGRPRADFLGKTNRELGMPADLCDRWDAALRAVFADGRPQELEFTFDNGQPWHLALRFVPEFGPDGTVGAVLGVTHDITNRVRAEAALRESEERFRALFDNATDAIFLHLEGGAVADVNRHACAALGCAREELIGRMPAAFDAALTAEQLADLDAQFRAGRTATFDTLHRRKDGSTFPVEVRSRPIEIGHRRFGLSIARDITDRKRAEEALRESEGRLRLALSAAAAVAFVWDAASDKVVRYFSSEPALPATQLTPESVNDVRARVHPDDRAAFDAGLSACLAAGTEYRNSYRVVRPDGTARWLDEWGTLERSADGRPLRLTGISIDVTDRKRAEHELRESEVRYRTLIETSTDAIFLLAPDGRIRAVNPAAARMHGWAIDELVGMRIQDLDVPDSAAAAPERIRRVLGGETLTFEVEHRRRDGSAVPLEVLASAVDLGGERLILSFDRDITDRKRAEAELRAERDRLALVLDRMPVGCVMNDTDLRFTYWNPGAERIFGWTAAEAVGRSAYDLIIPTSARPVVDPALAAVTAGHRNVVINENVTRDGRTIVCEWTNTPLLDPDGRHVGYLAMVQDVTERRRAEQAVREAEARRRLALDAARMGTWDLDLTTGRAVWDPRQQELFGLAPGTFDGDIGAFYRLLHPDDRGRVDAEVAAAAAGEVPHYEGEFRVLLGPGQTRWLYGRGQVFRDAGGRAVRMVGINYDVTERRHAEAALRVSEERLRQVVENARVVIWEADPTTLDFTYVSDFGEALLGFPAGDWLRPGFWRERLHPDDAAGAVEFCRTCTLAGRDHRFEYRMLRADGAVVWVDDAVRLLTRDGRLAGLQGAIIDITERKRAEEALRASEERLQEAQRIARLGYWEADLATGQSWWSDEEYRIFGVTPEAYTPHPDRFPQLIHPDDRAAHRAAAERLISTGGAESLQFRIVRPDGSVRHVYEEARVEPRPGSAPLLRGVTQDVTDRAEAELALRAALQEKVVMLKEIHHRVKNNLQIITSLLSLQAAQVTHPAAAAVLAESQNRVRVMALVHEALYQSDDLARVNLARYLGELCEYLFRAYGADPARVRLELAVDPVAVPLDKTIPCGLVVNEVVSNALKYAFPDGRSGTIGVRLAAAPGGRLTLTLWDDGVGLPAGVEVGSTPSLGLQLVSILTDQLGGTLSVGRSGGTRFDIAFAP